MSLPRIIKLHPKLKNYLLQQEIKNIITSYKMNNNEILCNRSQAEHVLRKIHHCTFGRKIFRRPFLGFYPKNGTFYLGKIPMTFFCHCPFLRCSTLHIDLFPLPELNFSTTFFNIEPHNVSLLRPFTPFYTYPHAVFHDSTPCFVLS